MVISLICDLHLGKVQNTLQYDVLDFAIKTLTVSACDAIIYAGDVTCDGDYDVFCSFTERMKKTGIPFLYIPGNSDLRNVSSREKLKNHASPIVNRFGNTTIFAVNDCDGTLSDEALSAVMAAKDGDIVFMHHSPYILKGETAKQLCLFLDSHPNITVFYGHAHKSEVSGNKVCLGCLDPDKSIGESPVVTFYDTKTKALSYSHYPCSVPHDLKDYFGISCYKPSEQLLFACRHKLEYVELRPNCADCDSDELKKAVGLWFSQCGKELSIHLPDIAFENGKVLADSRFEKLIHLAKLLGAKRFTQHVPKISVKTAHDNSNLALVCISRFLGEKLSALGDDIILGVENMHMTKNDLTDDTRRFGYTPEECILFADILSKECPFKVGFNFDIGHARNNAPYSRTYQISTWFNLLGSRIVGYHIHQVTKKDGGFENHTAITAPYGKLISLCSTFKCWEKGDIAKAPFIFEMRPDDAYATTLDTFRRLYKSM